VTPLLEGFDRYVDQEIRAPNNQLPPLEDGLALMAIRTEARRFKCVFDLYSFVRQQVIC